jgi:group I intron endonuclease
MIYKYSRKTLCGIYEIKCTVTDKVIIGSSIDIFGRYRHHLSDLRRCRHSNPYLQNAWNKYGENNFEFNIVEECKKKNLLKLEDEWMIRKKSLDHKFGYNLKTAERSEYTKEKKSLKTQVRLTATERMLLQKLLETDERLTISKLFRESLHKYCQEHNITDEIETEGVGNFTIG